MEKSFFEQIGGTYHREGGYLLPSLTVPESVSVGVLGQRHLRYIRAHRKALYTSLQLSGKLNSYLVDIDQQAQKQLDTIIQQMVQSQSITETLKATNPIDWVDRMNNIWGAAMEIVNEEVIYV